MSADTDRKNIYLSESLDERLRFAKFCTEKEKEKGNIEGAMWWKVHQLNLLNLGCLETLESEGIHLDEVLLYTDISHKDMGKLDIKKTRHLDLYLVKGSPLYNDVIELLKKHLSD